MAKTIICVDDEKFILDSFKKTIKPVLDKDYSIENSDGARDCLNLVNELLKEGHEIPVVVCDYIMPDIKGDELLSLIHKKSPKTKTILLTGLATTEGVTNAVNNASLYRYIAKPWQSEDIILTITEAIKSYENEKLLEKRRKELEAANEKLVRLDKSKSYFVQLLAHELRTPLTSISGFAEILSQLLKDDEMKEYCSNIIESSLRLQKFSDFSLMIVELLNETYSLEIKKSDFSHTLSIVLENKKEELAAKKIDIINDCNSNDIEFKHDQGLIKILLEIVIGNAIKYSNYNSNIMIRDFKTEKNYIFVVVDKGEGFSEFTLENIFKFFITDDIEYHSEGYGLGLALAKIIMDVHGGEIEVSNSGTGGAVVRLIFKI